MSLSLQISGLIAAYLVGAVPFGFILARAATGKNILHEGSGNVGSTNVRRIAGRKISFYTQVLDMLKGLLPVAVFFSIPVESKAQLHTSYVYALALAAVLGHDFSIFLGFRGGKGVNTSLGASVLLAPWSVLAAGLVYFTVKKLFSYVSLGSLFLALTLPSVELMLNGFSATFYFLLLLAGLIVILHRKNIQRLLAGNENL